MTARPTTKVAPATMVSDSLRTQAASRVGNNFTINSTATAFFETVNNYEYLRDIRPPDTQSSIVQLETEEMFSSYCTLIMSYPINTEEEEKFIQGVGDAAETTVGIREHKVIVRFGTASARHYVEADVSEGGAVAIPAATCEVSLLDYTFERDQLNGGKGKGLRSQAHLAAGGGSSPALYSERVLCPFQVTVDPLNPPTVEALIQALKEAACRQTILAVVP